MPECGTLTVESTFDPGAVTVSCQGVTNSITVGGSPEVNVRITNNNSVGAVIELEIYANGQLIETVDSENVPANDSVTRTYGFPSPSRPGDYLIEVESVNEVSAQAPASAPSRGRAGRALDRFKSPLSQL